MIRITFIIIIMLFGSVIYSADLDEEGDSAFIALAQKIKIDVNQNKVLGELGAPYEVLAKINHDVIDRYCERLGNNVHRVFIYPHPRFATICLLVGIDAQGNVAKIAVLNSSGTGTSGGIEGSIVSLAEYQKGKSPKEDK